MHMRTSCQGQRPDPNTHTHIQKTIYRYHACCDAKDLQGVSTHLCGESHKRVQQGDGHVVLQVAPVPLKALVRPRLDMELQVPWLAIQQWLPLLKEYYLLQTAEAAR